MSQIMFGDSEDYRFQSRFMAGTIYRHPIMQELNFGWRFEAGTEYICPIDQDLFQYMYENNKMLSFVIALYEYSETIPTLYDTVLDFASQHNEWITSNQDPDSLWKFIQDPFTKNFNGCHLWNNFQISNLDFFKSEKYQQYWEYIDSSNGIFYERWAVIASNGVHVTSEEIEANLLGEDIYSAPTRVVSLENTLNGMIFPIEELAKISKMARSKGLAMHLDGARLWNASQETGISLKEYGKLFDSMSLCLSKGVGAPIGSIVVGNAKFIDRVRHYRKLFGGGWRQAGFMAVAAKHGIEHIVPTMKETHQLAKYMADQLVAMGIDLQVPVHTNMVFIDTTRANVEIQRDLIPALAERNIKMGGMGKKARLVLHHQIDRQGVDSFLEVVRDVVMAARRNCKEEQSTRLALNNSV
ncbi:Putative Threonine aldolase [Rhizopus microsporus]|nr:Putative Threonine aldolase [Rhizopus microsporus]